MAKPGIINEVSVFSSNKRIRTLCHAQSLSRTSSKTNVPIIPCDPDEPICKDCVDEPPSTFFM